MHPFTRLGQNHQSRKLLTVGRQAGNPQAPVMLSPVNGLSRGGGQVFLTHSTNAKEGPGQLVHPIRTCEPGLQRQLKVPMKSLDQPIRPGDKLSSGADGRNIVAPAWDHRDKVNWGLRSVVMSESIPKQAIQLDCKDRAQASAEVSDNGIASGIVNLSTTVSRFVGTPQTRQGACKVHVVHAGICHQAQ